MYRCVIFVGRILLMYILLDVVIHVFHFLRNWVILSWLSPVLIRRKWSSTGIPTYTLKWTKVHMPYHENHESLVWIYGIVLDIKGLWNRQDVEGMVESEIAKYLQNG